MIYIIILFFIFVLFTFLGYVFHWMFHQRWSGPFYRAHMNHHLKQYPADDFYSDKYRDAGKDNTVYLFGAVFSPIIIGTLLLIITGCIGKLFGSVMLIEMFIIGGLNNYIHDAFHLRKNIWHNWPGFERLKNLHYQHHVDMRTNFGIFSFTWDKILKTFRNYP